MTSDPTRTGTRYRPNRLKDTYDAIVIGSGMGGLTTAACLAKSGYRVLVLEQHYTAGGFTHCFARNGYEWDVGLHYVGDMSNPHTSGRRIFDYISDNKLQWADMDKAFDQLFIGDSHYQLVAGEEDYRQNLLAYFPDEKPALEHYFQAMMAVRRDISLMAVGKALPGIAGRLAQWLGRRLRSPYYHQTTRQVLESFTDNQKLIAVLCGQWGDCGVPPAQSSFVIHSMIARHYMHGASYPVGGSSTIAHTVIPVIESAGGNVFTYAPVASIATTGNRATGVIMQDGHEINAPVVISNAGAFNTYNHLLPQSALPKGFAGRLKQLERSPACLCLYIGLADTAENLGLPKSNFWLYPDEHYEANIERFEQDPQQPIPLVYISFPSAKDPDFLKRYPGKATIEIIAPGPFEWFAPWQDTNWGKRGDDYENFKERWSQRLLGELYKKLPQLAGKIDYYELSTALSTAYFCRYEHGEIYGVNHTPARFTADWLKPVTPVRGLYLTGQDVMSCGIVGAASGGVLTAAAVQGFKGMKLVKQLLA